MRIATALPFHFADSDGLHFDGVRYGHATWVDATGARTPLTSRYESGAIRLTVPSVLVEASRIEGIDVDTANGRVAIASDGSGQSLLVFLNQRLHVAAKRLNGVTPIDATALTFATTADEQVQGTMASIPGGTSLLT